MHSSNGSDEVPHEGMTCKLIACRVLFHDLQSRRFERQNDTPYSIVNHISFPSPRVEARNFQGADIFVVTRLTWYQEQLIDVGSD